MPSCLSGLVPRSGKQAPSPPPSLTSSGSLGTDLLLGLPHRHLTRGAVAHGAARIHLIGLFQLSLPPEPLDFTAVMFTVYYAERFPSHISSFQGLPNCFHAAQARELGELPACVSLITIWEHSLSRRKHKTKAWSPPGLPLTPTLRDWQEQPKEPGEGECPATDPSPASSDFLGTFPHPFD